MKFGDAVGRVTTVDEAIGRMYELQEALGEKGVGCFNSLYRRVTEEIQIEINRMGDFEPGGFVETLDVEFANRYFAAVGAWFKRKDSGDAPKAWRPLFRRHEVAGITDLQFAAAGVNTHINFDLPHALVPTWETHQGGDREVQREEYDNVTGIFDRLFHELRSEVISDPLARFDEGEIRVGLDLASHVVVDRARDTAWTSGGILSRTSRWGWGAGTALSREFSEHALENPTHRIGNLILISVGPGVAASA